MGARVAILVGHHSDVMATPLRDAWAVSSTQKIVEKTELRSFVNTR